MELIAYSNDLKCNIRFDIPNELYTCQAAAKNYVANQLGMNQIQKNSLWLTFVESIELLPKKHQKKNLVELSNLKLQ